jgi:hypothetical protein
VIQRLDFSDQSTMPVTPADRAEFAQDCARWVNDLHPYCRHFLLGNEMEFFDIGAEEYVPAFQEAYAAMHAVRSDVIVMIGAFTNFSHYEQTCNMLGPNGYDGIGVHTGSTVPTDARDMLDRVGARPEVGVFVTEWGWAGTVPLPTARSRISGMYEGIKASNASHSRQIYGACWFTYDCLGWETFCLPLHFNENVAFGEQTAKGNGFNSFHDNPIAASNLLVTVNGGDSVTFSWDTNKPSTTQVFWRLQNDISGQSTTLQSLYMNNHAAVLNSLTSGTNYEFQAISTATGCGNLVHAPLLFRADGFVPVATQLGLGQVRINWQSPYAGDSVVNYGLDANYGQTVSDRFNRQDHEILLRGLLPGTLYTYEVMSVPQNETVWAVHRSGQQFFRTPSSGCRWGDADGDLFVGPTDYVAVRANFGQSTPGTGDADCIGFVNVVDYQMVHDFFGTNWDDQ